MEIITKIITGLGVVGTITGLVWIWNGSTDYIRLFVNCSGLKKS